MAWPDLPLLDSQRLVVRNVEPDHFALGIECVEVYVGNHTQGAGRIVCSQLRELAIREA